jgi:biotin-dependent carboxylase-like uncharacterized protein
MKFIKGGLLTSIQDLGRRGQMHLGIAQSGAMDPDSMRMANWLVGKPLDSAVFEITLSGPIIRFTENMSIAICGADFAIKLNEKTVSNDKSIHVLAGDSLIFGRLKKGCRAYLAFSGELDLQPILSSYSTHLTAGFGGYQGRQIKNADQLNITSVYQADNKIIPKQFERVYTGHYLLRCIRSIESDLFDKQFTQRFYQQSYQVTSDSNRMGIRLENQYNNLDYSIEITSSGLTQGSIQIPPSGQPIISSVDGQTIGGYPRIANICSADLPLLGQLNARDKVSFVLIDKAYALKILQEKQKLLSYLFKTINLDR